MIQGPGLNRAGGGEVGRSLPARVTKVVGVKFLTVSTQSFDVTIVDIFIFVMVTLFGLQTLGFRYFGFSNRRAGHEQNHWELRLICWGNTLRVIPFGNSNSRLVGGNFEALSAALPSNSNARRDQLRRNRVAQLLMLPQSHVAASCRRKL